MQKEGETPDNGPETAYTSIEDTSKSRDSGEMTITWSECARELSIEAARWRNLFEPGPNDTNVLGHMLDVPGVHIVPDLHSDEVEQILYWLPQTVLKWATAEKWFMRGNCSSASVAFQDVYYEALSEIAATDPTSDLADRTVQSAQTPSVIMIVLDDGDLIVDAEAIAEVTKRLGDTNVSLLILLESQDVAGAVEEDVLWAPDMQQLWWRNLFMYAAAENKVRPTEDTFHELCEKYAKRLANIEDQVRDQPLRRNDLRQLLLQGDRIEKFIHAAPSDAIELAIVEFEEQNRDLSSIKAMLQELFRRAPNAEEEPADRFALEGRNFAPREPHCTVLFVIWASMLDGERKNLRISWVKFIVNKQLAALAEGEKEQRKKIKKIAKDKSLDKKTRKKELAKLETPFTDFQKDLARDSKLEAVYGFLGAKPRIDKKRGVVLDFDKGKAINVIGDYLTTEAHSYLEKQTRIFLEDGLKLFHPEDAIRSVAQRVQVYQFKNGGSLTESWWRQTVKETLYYVLDRAMRAPPKTWGSSLQFPSRLADFVVYWYTSQLGNDSATNEVHQQAVRDLASDIMHRIAGAYITVGIGPTQSNRWLLVQFVTRLAARQEALIDVPKVLKIVANSAPAEMHMDFIKFVNGLGGVQNLEELNDDNTAKKSRRTRLQYELFDAVFDALEEVRKNDRPPNAAVQLLARLALRIVANCLIRASTADYLETDTPDVTSDRFMSKVLKSDEAIAQVVQILLRPPVKRYAETVHRRLLQEDVEKRLVLVELWQLVLIQFAVSNKLDLRSEDDRNAEDAAKLMREMQERLLLSITQDYQELRGVTEEGLEMIEAFLKDEEMGTLMKVYPFKLLLEFFALLYASGRKHQMEVFHAALKEELEKAEDQAAFNAAREIHVDFLRQLAAIAKAAYRSRAIDKEATEHALAVLMKRKQAVTLLRFH